MWRGTAAARPKAAESMTSEDFMVSSIRMRFDVVG